MYSKLFQYFYTSYTYFVIWLGKFYYLIEDIIMNQTKNYDFSFYEFSLYFDSSSLNTSIRVCITPDETLEIYERGFKKWFMFDKTLESRSEIYLMIENGQNIFDKLSKVLSSNDLETTAFIEDFMECFEEYNYKTCEKLEQKLAEKLSKVLKTFAIVYSNLDFGETEYLNILEELTPLITLGSFRKCYFNDDKLCEIYQLTFPTPTLSINIDKNHELILESSLEYPSGKYAVTLKFKDNGREIDLEEINIQDLIPIVKNLTKQLVKIGHSFRATINLVNLFS